MRDLYMYILLFCLIIAPVQLIGGLIRLARAKHKSKYSKGLNRYFLLVVGYFLSYLVLTVLENTLVDVDPLLFVFMPIIPLCIAMYYWIVIYRYSRVEIDK